ncbi:MAG: Rnf-Nqr domain containing protein [Oscillospiraceae bacterium]
MTIISNLLSAALYAMLFQNLIFTGGFGASEAVRMAAKPKQLVPMSLFITYFSTVVSVICVWLDQIPEIRLSDKIIHSIIFAAVLIIIYFITLFFIKVFFKVKDRTIRRLGISAFNTLVLAVPFINYRAAFNITDAIGAGIGSGLAFVIAVLLINFGLRRLDKNESIPEAFKGTPAIFIYVAILSMAFTGITGRGLTL